METLSWISLLSFFVAAPQVTLRIPGAGPQTPRFFSLGVPFAKGALPKDPSFGAVDANGSKQALRSWSVSSWPDGSPHWMIFEGRAVQEKLLLLPNSSWQLPVLQGPSFRVVDERRILDTGTIRIQAHPSEECLFVVEHESWTLRGDLCVLAEGESICGSKARRDLFEEKLGGVSRCLRIQGDLSLPEKTAQRLRFDLRLSPRLDPSRLDLEILVSNPARNPREITDLECVLVIDDRARAFWTLHGEKFSRLSAPSGVFSSTNGEGFCWEGRNGLCLAARHMRELGPKEIVLAPEGRIHLRILAGKATLPAEGSVGWTIPLRFHRAGEGKREHRGALQGMRRADAARPIPEESRGLDREIYPQGPALLPKFEEFLTTGACRLKAEMSGQIGWRDYGDHRLRHRWSHLEYDTAAGMLRLGVRRDEESWTDLAAAALEHWKTQDRFFTQPGSARRLLPAVHGAGHAAGSDFESGHVWAEGLLLHYAMTGNLSSREAALDLGDSLLLSRAWGRQDGSGLERHWAWPLIALSSLHPFFPDRGYDRAMEEIVDELLLHMQESSGYFLFDGRIREEENSGLVNLWLSGLLLEAMGKYHRAGGKKDLHATMRRLAGRIIGDGWDPKRQRFFHTVELDLASGATIARWGTLKPSWEVYLIAQLLEVESEENVERVARPLRRRLRQIQETISWPKDEVGNDLSLLWRAEAALLRSFSGS